MRNFNVWPKGSRRRALAYRPCLEGLEDRLAPASLPGGFQETLVAGGLNNPTAMELAPDGRLWVLEQSGRVEVFHAGSTVGWEALNIPAAALNSVNERGLLGIAFDPSYDIHSPAADYVLLYFTSTASPGVHNRVSRFTVDNTNPDQPVLGNEIVIVDLDPLSSQTNHNGGAIHFGPDGKLYIAVGDNANGANSQSLDNRLGKILRLNADGTIPSDNPSTFAGISGSPTGANRAIWAVGLRNPFTFSFQPGTGTMFINDVGANSWEEVDQGAAGANYGWPLTEGDFSQSQFPMFTRPLVAYAHGSGAFRGFAITGGTFYNPSSPGLAAFPSAFHGRYFFADFVNGWIDVYNASTGVVTSFATGASGPVDLHVGADGSLYYLARNGGQVMRATYASTGHPDAQSPVDKITADQPTFTWTAVAGAVHYDFWVDDQTSGQSQVLRNSNVSGTTWTPTGTVALTPGHSYRWWAGAVSAGGGTVWSFPQDFVIAPLPAPMAGGPNTTIATDQPTFTWNSVTGAAHYDIWVDDRTTGQSQALRNSNAGGTSWTPAGTAALTPSHGYRWWVGAVSINGTTSWSLPQDFAIAPLPAPTAGGPNTTVSTDQPTFTWNSVTGAAHYDVWVDDRTTGQSQALRNSNAGGTSWTPTGTVALTPGHSYRWWAGAVSHNGTTFWSLPQDFAVAPLATPGPISPAGMTAVNPPTFRWNAVADAARYDIWVDDLTIGQSQVLRNTNAGGTSWSPPAALTTGHSYRWWVRALSTNDTASSWSDPLDFMLT